MEWIAAESNRGDGMDRKELERKRGFLIHIARTYPDLVLYLKGIYHTLDSWRGGRDEDGWKLVEQEIRA